MINSLPGYLGQIKKLLLQMFLLCGFCIGLGCASNKPSPRPLPANLSVPTHQPVVRESFDPASLQEDLLLIQPGFPPPKSQPPPHTTKDTAVLTGILPEQPVYSVQVMALSSAQKAQQRADVLAQMLKVPVDIAAERGLFIIRAGSASTLEAATALKEQIKAHFPAYANAFIFDGEQRLQPGQDLALVDTIATKAIFIQRSGWRILLDQFLSYEEAATLKKTATQRLKRTDIDISFEAPWYKVQIGHFLTIRDAQELFELVRRRRFTNALKVRGEIQVPQEMP